MLIAESESSPDQLLEGVAEVAEVFSTRAMRRVLNFCTLQVRADLLMIILRSLPIEVYSNLPLASVFAPVQTNCNLTVMLNN
jgi:hypothetical protein